MPQHLNIAMAAEISGVSESTLYGWARSWDRTRTGPKPKRLGPRLIRYSVEDVAAWLDVPVEQLAV